ncbi:MAG: hypothetical protein LBI92_09575 [Azoarcus sp.]|jgi:hypothetical protein|nr:hypothetical protein [Azoarcus sp.]
MENVLTETKREDIWEALSDAFVDTDVDYDSIAARISDVEPAQLEHIFFSEVAPVCGYNLMSPAPSEWIGFDREELFKMIREMQERNKNSAIAQIRHKLFVRFCRWNFRGFWRSISTRLPENHA